MILCSTKPLGRRRCVASDGSKRHGECLGKMTISKRRRIFQTELDTWTTDSFVRMEGHHGSSAQEILPFSLSLSTALSLLHSLLYTLYTFSLSLSLSFLYTRTLSDVYSLFQSDKYTLCSPLPSLSFTLSISSYLLNSHPTLYSILHFHIPFVSMCIPGAV